MTSEMSTMLQDTQMSSVEERLRSKFYWNSLRLSRLITISRTTEDLMARSPSKSSLSTIPMYLLVLITMSTSVLWWIVPGTYLAMPLPTRKMIRAGPTNPQRKRMPTSVNPIKATRLVKTQPIWSNRDQVWSAQRTPWAPLLDTTRTSMILPDKLLV